MTLSWLPWKPTRKYIFIVIIVAVFFALYNFLSVFAGWDYEAKFDYECSNGSKHKDNVIHHCIKGPSIFFTETSHSTTVNVRQACAVESASRHNPSMSVTVLMTGSEIDESNPLISRLRTLPNVLFHCIDVDVFVHGTALWAWYREGKWKKSKWSISHLSDALRFFVMWKYGGMYLDLDTVTLRSMEHLENAVVTENWDRVAAGILVFRRYNQLMGECMDDFAAHYDKDNFALNGPGIIGRNIRKLCGVDDIGKVSGSDCPINILPPEAAFPIEYDKWKDYFEPNNVTDVAKYFASSYLIHVWNKYSAAGLMQVGQNSLYETAIREHCPLVYQYAKTKKYM